LESKYDTLDDAVQFGFVKELQSSEKSLDALKVYKYMKVTHWCIQFQKY